MNKPLNSLIRLVSVTKRYPSGPDREIVPVKGVNLEISEGERIILLGKSGSGKTTLLNIIGGVDSPTDGSVFFSGRDLGQLSPEELALYRRREVGFIFQSFNLFSTLTVGENVMLPLELIGVSGTNKAREILDAVGLNGSWNMFPEQLSGGEQQRVAIARALVKAPKLILADEPTGNLDQETGEDILTLMYEISTQSATSLIMATHSQDALWIADRQFRIRSGVLIEENAGEIQSHVQN
jgi:putative ABC transport system ATP-binding protein